MTDHSAVLVKKEGIDCVALEDGGMLKVSGEIHMLNETAFEIFNLCDGVRTIREIILEMKALYTEEEVEGQIEEFIGKLMDSGLLVELEQ